MHLIPFLSLFSELLPPHPHELHLQTPRSFSITDVVASGVNEPMPSEETEERNSVIKTSAYNFLGYTTKKKSRGRSISSLLSTQVPRRFAIKLESGGQSVKKVNILW